MSNKEDPLRNLGAATARNFFTNAPMEFVVPKTARVVFVADMFAEEYSGGAELTSEAIIEKCPYGEVFRVHSTSLTQKMLENHKDKFWIFGNYVNVDPAVLAFLANSKDIRYAVIEYDFKYCSFRSEALHQQKTGKICDCYVQPHGHLIEKFYMNAENIFWMSQRQAEHFKNKVPSLIFADKVKHVIQGSTFTEETLNKLLSLRELHEKSVKSLPIKIWGVQGSKNWIKGTKETVEWASREKMPIKVLGEMTYDKFLEELAKCTGFIFRPLDFDTCPRVVIEAKILGCELSLGEKVQHKDEEWFRDYSLDEMIKYLKSRPAFFWENIKL